MTMVEPISDAQWGKADWQDYVNNWREKDAEWLMARTIMRFQTNTDRDAKLTSPGIGQVIFNADPSSGTLEIRGPTGWVPYKPMPIYLVKGADDSAQVLISHKDASGKGVSFTPTTVSITANFSVLGGVLGVDPTGVTVKTGAKTARLTTDATTLISDSPVSVPSLTATGAVTAASVTAPTISGVTTLTAASINMSGTLTGGVLNGLSGLIGGVALGTAAVGGTNIVNASDGFQSQAGMFYGSGANAYVRQRAANKGALGSSYLEIGSANANFYGDLYMRDYLRIMGGKGVPWHNAAGTHVAWLSPVIYSGSDPGAANYPDGSLWIS